jgi:hypothetical protein
MFSARLKGWANQKPAELNKLEFVLVDATISQKSGSAKYMRNAHMKRFGTIPFRTKGDPLPPTSAP